MGTLDKYIRYGFSLIRHKWLVFLECIRSGIPFCGITHDLSKFRPSEFIPYARYYGRTERQKQKTGHDEEIRLEQAADLAWNLHQKRNRHHWQFWVLLRDNGLQVPLEMGGYSAIELLCDWRAFGRQHGKSAGEYYQSVEKGIKLAPESRELLEELLEHEQSGRRCGWMGIRIK